MVSTNWNSTIDRHKKEKESTHNTEVGHQISRGENTIKREKNTYKKKSQTINKMAVRICISIITWNVNGLYDLTNRWRLNEKKNIYI